MDAYQANLAGLLVVCSALFWTQSRPATTNTVSASSPWTFLVVYALVMGADWLQVSPGPGCRAAGKSKSFEPDQAS